MHVSDTPFIISYSWLGTRGTNHVGVSVVRRPVLAQAVERLEAELEEAHAPEDVDSFHVLSAVNITNTGPEVMLLLDLGVTSSTGELWDADRMLGSKGPNWYVVTATSHLSVFVQYLRARYTHGALLAVRSYIRKTSKSPIEFVSVTEVFPDRTAIVMELGGRILDEVNLDVVERIPPPGASSSTRDDMDAINRHRRSLGMPPLDPRAAGWSAEDIRLEAERIATLPNPLEDLKHRLI